MNKLILITSVGVGHRYWHGHTFFSEVMVLQKSTACHMLPTCLYVQRFSLIVVRALFSGPSYHEAIKKGLPINLMVWTSSVLLFWKCIVLEKQKIHILLCRIDILKMRMRTRRCRVSHKKSLSVLGPGVGLKIYQTQVNTLSLITWNYLSVEPLQNCMWKTALDTTLEVLGMSFPSHVNDGHCNNTICDWRGLILLISDVALTGVMIGLQLTLFGYIHS